MIASPNDAKTVTTAELGRRGAPAPDPGWLRPHRHRATPRYAPLRPCGELSLPLRARRGLPAPAPLRSAVGPSTAPTASPTALRAATLGTPSQATAAVPRRTEPHFLGDPPALAAIELGLPVLLPDVQIMRRQRCHYVYGPDGSSLAIHRTIGEAIAQILQDYGSDLAVLAVSQDERVRYVRVTVQPPTEKPSHG